MTTSYFFYAMIVCMGLALGAVVFGLVQSIKGGVNSAKAMKVRILFQGVALILFGILMYINKGGFHG